MALAPRQRTKDALAMKRAEGVRLGRPPAITGCVAERIMRERAEGATLAQIAARLTEDGVPTPRGGKEWRPSSLESLLQRSQQREQTS